MDWRKEYSKVASAAKRSPFPSLTRDSEFERLEDIGGPAPIGPSHTHFFPACSDFRELQVLEILMKYTDDLERARRHWPWVALSAFEYKGNQTYDQPSEDPAPSDVENLLSQLRKDAGRLQNNLNRLSSWHQKPRDFAHSDKRGHLEYLEAVMTQHVAGRVGMIGDVDAKNLWVEKLKFQAWQEGLSLLLSGIPVAQKLLDKDLLTSPLRVTISGLHQLVGALGIIWKSMTDRTPSANKVHRKSGDSQPEFVRFVQEVAELSECEIPELSQVRSALAHLK